LGPNFSLYKPKKIMNKFYLLIFSIVITASVSAQNCADQWKAVF